MTADWLWDRKISAAQAKKILNSPEHKDFILLAALLFARKNNPKEIFNVYIKPSVFCAYWAVIKKRMRRDKWNEPRIIFWQAIYENLKERYRKQGKMFRKGRAVAKDPLCENTGREIRDIRRGMGLSQKDFAKKIGVSQQLISRIEQGRENVSLGTLDNISRALGKELRINFGEAASRI